MAITTTMNTPAFYVQSAGKLIPCKPDNDIRGLVCIWEQPRAGAQYYIGVAPQLGIVGWSRDKRSESDTLTPSATIEVVRKGRNGPDAQVCEFAAPIHCEDLAEYVNLLGRWYGVSEDEGQAPCIIEIWPGPGHMTQRRLIEEFGYTNLFVWKYTDQMALKSTGSIGWSTTARSERDLWLRGMRHLSLRKIALRSEWLVEEMADVVVNPQTGAGMVAGLRRCDRVKSLLLALWMAHEWSLEQPETEPTKDAGIGERPIDWQLSDMSQEEWLDAVEERFAELAEED